MSIAAFAGTILFAADAARIAAGSRAGLLAATLVACSVAFGLQPAAAARPYALAMMFAAMAVWAVLKEARLPLLTAHLLGLFTHPVFIFFSAASAAAAAVFGRRGRALALAPVAAAGTYALAWGMTLARTAALPTTSWMRRPDWSDVLSGLSLWGGHATPILVVTILLLVAVRGARTIRPHAEPLAFLGLLTALVLAGTIAVSMVRPVYLASRTPVLVLPGVAIAVAVLIAELGPLLVTCAAAALVLVSAVRFTVRAVERPDRFPTRASLAAVAPRMRCGDTIIAAGLAYAPIAYYAPKAGVPACVTLRAFPREVGSHPGWLDVTASDGATLGREAELAASSKSAGTLWIFEATQGIGAEAGAALVDAVSRIRRKRESIAASGSFFDRIVIFDAPPSSPARP